MRLTVVGTGYVGLVSGACFADFGHEVTCVDLDDKKISKLKEGKIPIYEPGLDRLVEENSKAGRLHFTTNLANSVASADAVFIAVGTPSRRGDGHADLKFVFEAAKDIARRVERPTVIVTKSTVPVGTGDEVARIVREVNPNVEIHVASNPEFLREGSAIEDFKRPDRIVIGVDSDFAKNVLEQVYRPLYLNRLPLLTVSRQTAELTKYAANAFLAMKITFINEIADLCEKVGANVQDVAVGIGMDNRIGRKFLNAGPGYGGSCFPKDTLALVKTAQDFDSPVRLIETTVMINDQRKRAMGRRVIAGCNGDVRGKTVGVWGLTFKPDTDDMRDAPSIAIVQTLQDAGARVKAYDPEGMEAARSVLENVEYADDAYKAAEGADAIVLVTEWNQFRSLDLKRVKAGMKGDCFVDLRNVYSKKEAMQAGFRYSAVGTAHE
jgi:UDPglucose 6-dehydrogenase